MKRLRKRLISICLSSLVLFMFVGCFNKSIDKNDKPNNYKEYALQELENKYGEKFEIKQTGGTFGATNDNKKLMCYPVSDKNAWFEVQVEKDLSKVYDDYQARLLEKLVAEKLEKETREVFGEEVTIKPYITTGYLNDKKIDFDTFDLGTYIEQEDPDVILNVFINRENNNEDAAQIYNYIDSMNSYGINKDVMGIFYFLKEDCYKDLEKEYYERIGKDKFYSYFYSSERSYSRLICERKDGKVTKSIDEISQDLVKGLEEDR